MIAWEVVRESLTITAFVAVMMVAIEYLNVWTRGLWIQLLNRSRLGQYALAVVLGAIPGCMGAFVLVALYMHRRVTVGCVVAGMIATSGDEMFVMLAVFPRVALLLTLGLAVLGVAAGWATDSLLRLAPASRADCPCDFDIHEAEACRRPTLREFVHNWRSPSAHRVLLTIASAVFVLAICAGQLGPSSWDWKRVTLLLVACFGLFIVGTVADHFLDTHLWRHVARVHVPRIFLFTTGALAVLAVFDQLVDLQGILSDNRWLVLVAAALVGIIPESGPHLIFVTMYASGVLPLSVLIASSAVQDGHGMLPLFAHSRRDFLRVKAVNLAVGVATGAVMMLLGW
jgi:hypothetical protein